MEQGKIKRYYNDVTFSFAGRDEDDDYFPAFDTFPAGLRRGDGGIFFGEAALWRHEPGTWKSLWKASFRLLYRENSFILWQLQLQFELKFNHHFKRVYTDGKFSVVPLQYTACTDRIVDDVKIWTFTNVQRALQECNTTIDGYVKKVLTNVFVCI